MPPQIEQKKKFPKWLKYVLGILLILIVVLVVAYRYTDNLVRERVNYGESRGLLGLDPAGDWKTYVNEKSGYEFKYPNNWFAETNRYNNGNTLFGPNATSGSGIGGVELMGKLKTGQSLKDFVREFNRGVESGATSETESKINSQEVVISILPHSGIPKMETESVAFENNNQVFNVYLGYHADTEMYTADKANLAIFNQMLSTFKFTK